MRTGFYHKLLPMTTFVIEYYSNEGYADLQTLNLMNKYAKLMKQTLLLGMFVPVDTNGNVLKEPKNYSDWRALKHNKTNDSVSFEENKIYKKAEGKCFFEGFKVVYNGYSVVRIVASYNESIELSFNKNDLKCQGFADVESLTALDDIYLTTFALKSIGIKNK